MSSVCAWEIVVKAGFGRLEVPEPVDRFVTAQLEANAFLPLSISMRHALDLASQALAEELTLVSGDRVFAAYPVTTEW